MDILGILSSLNIISLIAFFVTVSFLGYQVYSIKKDINRSSSKPIIPDFNESILQKRQNHKIELKEHTSLVLKKSKTSKSFIILLIFVVIFLSIFALSGIVSVLLQKKTAQNIEKIRVNYVASKGIRVYNKNWTRLTDSDYRNLKIGDEIIIGIETIAQVDIDKARIRINSNEWTSKDETTLFNKSNNVFYIDYTISLHSGKLRIGAQLHSKSEGWIGN